MSLSREVADAYISVHGDLSEFRKDLERGRAVVSDQGELLADDFSDAMKKQDTKNMKDRWGALTKAFYSGEKLDWERVLGQFNGSSLGKQRKQISAFMEDMQSAGYMTEEQFKETDKAMKRALITIGDHRRAQQGITKEVADAKFQQDQYNRSLRGMADAADLDAFEARWKKLGQTLAGVSLDSELNDVDWSKMQKGTSSLEDFDDTMNDVIIRARLLGRVTDEESDKVLTSLGKYITAEKERARTLDESTSHISRMRTEADRAKISLSGMIESAKTKELERDFNKIAAAMATMNWGPVAKDHKSMQEFTRRTIEVTDRMRELGRVSDQEYGRVRTALGDVVNHQNKFGVSLDQTNKKFRPLQFAIDKMAKSWKGMDKTARLVMTLIAAGASDLATLGSGVAGSATALVSSLASAAGSVVPLAAGMTAFGVAIGLAVSGMDDLKAAFPGVQTAMDNVGRTWQGQAKSFGLAWGESLQNLLENFNTQLGAYDFGTPLGEAFAGITDAFNGVLSGPGFAAFMTAMTGDLPRAVEGLGTGFANLTNLIVTMFAGAAPVAAQLGADFANWSKNLADVVERARESGELTKTFEQMRESLLAVLDFTGSLGMALGTLFGLGASSGNSMLKSLTGIVDQFTAWMNTDSGRATMLSWFSSAETIMRSMEPLVVGLAKAMAILVTPQTIAMFGDLMSTLGELLPIVAEVLAVISQLGIFNIIATAVLAVGKALQPLLPHLGELATLIGDLLITAIEELTPILVEVAELFAPILGAIVDLAQFLVPVLIPAIRIFGEALRIIVDVLGNVVKAVVDFLSSGERIGQFFTDLGSSITTMNDTVNQALADFWGGIGAQLATWGAEFAAGWNAFWGGLGSGIADIWNGFIGMITDGWTAITTAFTTFSALLQVAWDTFWNNLTLGVQIIWQGFLMFLDSIWLGIQNSFMFFVGLFQTFWTSFWNALDPEVQAVFVRIGTFISEAWTNIVNGWNGFVAIIQAAWNIFWQGLSTFVSDTWNTITTAISTGINTISAVVSGFAAAVSAEWNNFWNAVGTTVTNAWNDFTAHISGRVDAIRTDITNFVSTVTSAWNNFWTAVGNAVRNAWTQMTSAVNNGINQVRNYISSTISNIQAGWNAGWNAMGNIISSAWSNMVNAVSNGVNNVMNFIGSLPGRIVGALGNMAGLLVNAGAAIINGFLNGLRNAFAAVQNFVGGIAGWIAANKGPIPYDRKLLIPAGNAIMEGLGKGLEDKLAMLKSVLNIVTDTMTDTVTEAFDKSKMYVAGADAALGLANGLASNKRKIASAISGLDKSMSVSGGALGVMTPQFKTPTSSTDSAVGGGRSVVVETGAIQITTQAKNPETVAGIVLDDLAGHTKLG